MVQIKDLFHHRGSILASQLNKLFKLALWDNDGAFKVLAAKSDNFFRISMIQW